MSLLQNSNAITPSGGYNIDNSCRFNGADSAYLKRTSVSAGNRKTWTASFWVKRGKSGGTGLQWGDQAFICAKDGAEVCATRYTNNGVKLCLLNYTSSPNNNVLKTTAVYLDPAAWYHVVFAVDTSQNTAADRCKVFVNGVEETAMDEENYPTQNTNWQMGDSGDYFIGQYSDNTNYANYYLAELHYVDGLQLTPASFAEADEDTNQWKAIKYTGAYGTNGVFLEFKDSGALGTDTSGNGNNFTVYNLVATDQMIDTPQNTNGGNFCTLSPLVKAYSSNPTISEGNLKSLCTTAGGVWVAGGPSTFGMSSGKWYWEWYCNSITSANGAQIGIVGETDNKFWTAKQHAFTGSSQIAWEGVNAANKVNIDGTDTAYSDDTYETGDICSVALDMDSGTPTVTFYLNGVTRGALNLSVSSLADETIFASINSFNAAANVTFNFGQDSTFAGIKTAGNNKDANGIGDFYYTVPAGHLALCTDNLPDPSIVFPGEQFNTVLYTGNGGSSTDAITGVGFQPDLNWIKKSSATANHYLTSSTLGLSKGLTPDTAAATDNIQRISSFDSDGFTLPATLYSYVNTNGANYVSWNWKATGSTVSNTVGTITSTVDANTTAGLSILTYTGNGLAHATFGHGLSTTPDLIVIKNVNMASQNDWLVWTPTLGSSGGDCTYLLDWAGNAGPGNWCSDTIHLNGTTKVEIASGASNNIWQWVNKTGEEYVCYCWTNIEGYSKRGVYKGNGNTDGAFAYTGFRPAYLWLRGAKVGQANSHWHVFDTKRYTYNHTSNTTTTGIVIDTPENAGGGGGEGCGPIDILSNGFKLRNNNGNGNDANTDFTYLAFAEYPFKYTRAR